MTFQYKHVLIIGATSGIGRAMANRFVAEGVKVTVVGRRQERLDAFVAEHGNEKASAIAFDIACISEIPDFVNSTLKTHPTIDSVFLNAAAQGHTNFSKPESVDLQAFNHEFSINFVSYVALVHAVLPHLLARDQPTSLIFTGSQISLVPAFPMPAYCASKAALDTFIMCLREQLRDTKVKVAHVSPGPVQTELHDSAMGEEKGSKFGMPLEDFVSQTYAELVEGRNDIFPGTVGGSTKEQFLEIVEKRDAAFTRMSTLVRSLYF